MPGSALTLELGGWAVDIDASPWSLALRAAAGPEVREAPARRGAIGPPGFQTRPAGATARRATGAARHEVGPHNALAPSLDDWWEATEVRDHSLEGDRWRGRLVTTHPGGWELEISIEPAGHGALAVEISVAGARPVEAVGHGFVATGSERWLGFGERSDAVARTAGEVEAYVGEGPYQEYEYEILRELIPAWAMRQRPDATYYPVPWALSTRGIGVLVDNDEVSRTRLRPAGLPRWSIEAEAGRLAYRVWGAPSPLEVLESFTAATGRQPAPAAAWWFGPWVQTGHANHVPLAEEAAHVATILEAGAALSAVETHCRYLPLGEHRGHEADEAARTAHFHAAGLATLSYLNPFVGVDYREAFEPAAAAGGLQTRADGAPYVFTAYAGGRTPPEAAEAQVDFTAASGVAAWAAVAEELVALGHDGWMEDFGEYTPFDAHSADGSPGESVHNRYPTDYHRAATQVADDLGASHGRPLARFVRSGWTGTAPWAPIVWGGDPTTGWGFDGLSSALRQALSIGTSGIAMWGSDTGGFFSSIERLDVELLIRWIQFSAFCPVLRTKSSGIEVPAYRRPQVWDPEVLPAWRRWAGLHTQLVPYLQAAHSDYRASGIPIMRACGLLWPGIAELVDADDQYLLGPELLVAPVLAPGATSRRVVVPPGRWVELWSAYRYDEGGGGLVASGAAPVVHGGPTARTVELAARIDLIPVLVREGAHLDLLDPSITQLAGAGEHRPTVRLDF